MLFAASTRSRFARDSPEACLRPLAIDRSPEKKTRKHFAGKCPCLFDGDIFADSRYDARTNDRNDRNDRSAITGVFHDDVQRKRQSRFATLLAGHTTRVTTRCIARSISLEFSYSAEARSLVNNDRQSGENRYRLKIAARIFRVGR